MDTALLSSLLVNQRGVNKPRQHFSAPAPHLSRVCTESSDMLPLTTLRTEAADQSQESSRSTVPK